MNAPPEVESEEELQVIQLGFLHNFINEHLVEQYEKWLDINRYPRKEGNRYDVVKEFMEEMDLQTDFRDWLIITYRKEHGNQSEEKIMKFVEKMSL